MKLLLLLLACGGLMSAADGPGCELRNAEDASKLVGARLTAASRSETQATTENGEEHQTACRYFPEGYDITPAEAPPERGLVVTFHAMPDAAAAKRYYEGIVHMLKEADEKLTEVPGIGDAAYFKPFKIPDSNVQTTTLTFLKGSVMTGVQVWRKGDSPDGLARNAAEQILAKIK